MEEENFSSFTHFDLFTLYTDTRARDLFCSNQMILNEPKRHFDSYYWICYKNCPVIWSHCVWIFPMNDVFCVPCAVCLCRCSVIDDSCLNYSRFFGNVKPSFLTRTTSKRCHTRSNKQTHTLADTFKICPVFLSIFTGFFDTHQRTWLSQRLVLFGFESAKGQKD